MKVMVTGATTSLGAAIVEHLRARCDVERVLEVGDDLGKPRAIHDLVWGAARELGIECVVHGAAEARDVDATRDLLLACADHPTIRRFVYRSYAEVYSLRYTTSDLLDEEAPLDFDPGAPRWVRDRVEADLAVCAHFAGKLEIAVLRCAEILAGDVGSQLWDYLGSRVCLRPLGFDPMLNVLSLADAAAAIGAAVQSSEVGVFNVPGFDTLPLSRAIGEAWRVDIPVPGPLMAPLYRLRRLVAGFDFSYEVNARRFHFGGVLDGTRARERLGYVPHTAARWPS